MPAYMKIQNVNVGEIKNYDSNLLDACFNFFHFLPLYLFQKQFDGYIVF